MITVGLDESPECLNQARNGICADIGLANLGDDIPPSGVNATKTFHQKHRLKQALLKAMPYGILKLLSDDVSKCAHSRLTVD